MTVNEIVSAIVHGDFTNDDLNKVHNAVTFAKSMLARQNKRDLIIGDTVKFTNSKTGMVYTGTIRKKAIKFATIATPTGMWRVPMSMLTPA